MDAELHLAFRLKDKPCETLVDRYRKRSRRYRGFTVYEHGSRVQLSDAGGGTWDVLLSRHGKPMSTERLAELWRTCETDGVRTARFLVGGPDGWPETAAVPTTKLAFGAMTMPHQLAAAVLAEQIYRVLTLNVGHPYHLQHSREASA